ncbi:hypothetical protein [Niveibacterium sp. SC-1]|uniref:hypothetical protein n=1 Tax=Niveibacterium sp. SC-1 TaxID=3135646 RepID=UPI00311ED6A8
MAYEHIEDIEDDATGPESPRQEKEINPLQAASATAMALGAAAGPGSVMAGAMVGVMAGGLASQSGRTGASTDQEAAEEVARLADEESYWRGHYADEPYVQADMSFDYYLAAYRTGMLARMHYPDRAFEDIDDTLAREYAKQRQDSTLPWESEGRAAARAAWDHMTRH